MEKTRIEYKGIARSVSDQLIQDGWLDELINQRFWKGRLRPVGKPTKVFNLPVDTYSRMWYHDQDNISNFIGQDGDNNLNYVNMETGAGTLVKAYTGPVQVEFVKRFMIVVHSEGMDRFLFKDDQYSLVTFPDRPFYEVSMKEGGQYVTEVGGVKASSILGKYYKKVNELSAEGKIVGGTMYRAAIRMFDGSYVLHTLPDFYTPGLSTWMNARYRTGDGSENDELQIKFYAGSMRAKIDPSHFSGYNSDIFTHLVIFACKNEELYDMDEDTLTDEVIEDRVLSQLVAQSGFNIDIDFKDIIDNVSPDFKKLGDSPSWYNVLELDISDIKDKGAAYYEDLDLTDFYQDYATRETLPVDQFSHHVLSANATYNYNGRLILCDAKTIFGNYKGFLSGYQYTPSPGDYTYEKDRSCKFVVTLKTADGDMKRVVDLGSLKFYRKVGETTMTRYTPLGELFGYPDARASKIELLVQEGVNWFKSGEWKLTKSNSSNYSYYHSTDFSNDAVEYKENNFNEVWHNSLVLVMSNPVNLNDYENKNSLEDANRIQISELSNPFYFPAENSYQVGTGRVLNVATNTVPLSTGQFGEHPLIVFTSKGRHAMFQGQDDVLFSNIKPLDGDVPENAEQIISVAGGVVYTTALGVHYVVGNDVQDISNTLYGKPNADLQANADYQLRSNHLQLVQLSGSFSQVNASDYMSAALLGYNHEYRELIITNNNYDYSYVYSFKSGSWHKISESYRVLINCYPSLYVLRENSNNDGVSNVSKEQFNNDVEALICTRPCKIDNDINFVLLHSSIQRCVIETSPATFASLVVFGSNDLINWQLMAGNDKKSGRVVDVRTSRIHHKVKYLVFVFTSTLKEDSEINTLDLQYYPKLSNKLR